MLYLSMKKLILALCFSGFCGFFCAAQVRHNGRHDDLLLVGTQVYMDSSGQKIAEVNYTDKGELIGFKTWDSKGLLIDDERVAANRKRALWPQELDFSFLENGIGFFIIHGRAESDAPAPRSGDKVSVHYELVLQDLTLIDETYGRKKPFKYRFQAQEVIPGFDEAVAMLKVGEEGYFYLPPGWAYGSRSVGGIPPFSALLYKIKLVDIN
jgi:hypothetical protein